MWNARGKDATVGDIEEGTDDDVADEDNDNDDELSMFLFDLLLD